MTPLPASAFTVEPTIDYAMVTAAIRHARIWPHIIDDYSPAPGDYECPRSPAILYLCLRDSGELLGYVMVIYESYVVLQVHFFILPNAYGDRARRAVRCAFDWVWKNYPEANRMIAAIPVSNSLACSFAKAVGMEEYGRDPGSFRKGGKLHDRILMGITRPKS